MEGVNILYMQSHWEVTTSMLTYIPAKLILKKKKKKHKKLRIGKQQSSNRLEIEQDRSRQRKKEMKIVL